MEESKASPLAILWPGCAGCFFPKKGEIKMKKATVTMIAVLLALILPQFALSQKLEPGEEIVTLNTRPEVTVRVLLSSPERRPKAVFVFFSGRNGRLVSEKSGRIRYRWVMSGLVERGFAVVTPDVPSDQGDGFSDEFSVSKAHTEDIKRVIEFARQKWPKSIFFYSHSRGTVSSVHLAAVLKDDHISGVVLTGSRQRKRGDRIFLSDMSLEDITYPVLFVHHKDDDCYDIEGVRKQSKRLIKSPRVDFVEVVGGDYSGSEPRCRANTPHSFAGQRKELINVIADWASGKPVPKQIGQ